MQEKTLTEACHEWVSSFNAIPIGVIKKLFERDELDVCEITPPSKYDRVYVYDKQEHGEIIETKYLGDMYLIKFDDGTELGYNRDDFEVEYDDVFPMWGTMWTFGESIDEEWADGEYLGSHLQEMADCGFRIYEQEDYGLIFGIDGAGYDFYESHWIPLYKARGLHWHTVDDTEKKAG